MEAKVEASRGGALADGRTALEVAAEHGHLDMVQLLLNQKRLGQDHYPKASKAAERNAHWTIKKLIESYLLNAPEDHPSLSLDTDGIYLAMENGDEDSWTCAEQW